MLPTSWYSCSGDPDYFNACDSTNSFSVPYNGFGYQQAADGRGYCGFYSFNYPESLPPFPYKEYLGCMLKNPLIVGQKYFVTFKISFCAGIGIGIASNNIGLLFSTVSFQDYQPYDNVWGIPTNNFAHIVDTSIIIDSQYWTTIKGSITADSAYKYLTIGNFFDKAHTKINVVNSNWLARSYYYLDNVCVSTDSLTCNPINAIYEKNNKEILLNVYPNPSTGKFLIESDVEIWRIEIYNFSGKLIYKNAIKESGKIPVNIDEYPSGIYLLKIIINQKIYSQKIIIIIKNQKL